MSFKVKWCLEALEMAEAKILRGTDVSVFHTDIGCWGLIVLNPSVLEETIPKLLEAGDRLFDIHYTKNYLEYGKAGETRLVGTYFEEQTLPAILRDISRFLDAHPLETIVLRLKRDTEGAFCNPRTDIQPFQSKCLRFGDLPGYRNYSEIPEIQRQGKFLLYSDEAEPIGLEGWVWPHLFQRIDPYPAWSEEDLIRAYSQTYRFNGVTCPLIEFSSNSASKRRWFLTEFAPELGRCLGSSALAVMIGI